MSDENKKELPSEKPATLFEADSDDGPVVYLEDEQIEEVVPDMPDGVHAADPEIRTIVEHTVDSEHITYSWWFPSLVTLILIVLADWVVVTFGRSAFWAEQVLYIFSLALIFVASISIGIWFGRKGRERRDVLIIAGLVGLVAGIVLSISRFVGNTAFWTFFNLIAQPINALILSLIGGWLGATFLSDGVHKKNKFQ